MTAQITYRIGNDEDFVAIATLLRNNKLPESDIASSKINFIVAEDNNRIAGCIGLEQYQADGLLRSFAVEEKYRSQGLGKALLLRLLSFSRQRGVETLHLLTITAEKYFLANGFVISDRENASPGIKTSAEFSTLCPSSSIYMKKNITNDVIFYSCQTQLLKRDKETGSSFWSVNGNNIQFTWFEVAAQTTFNSHQHNSEQITYVLEGELYFKIGEEKYKLGAGDSIVIPSGKEHSVWTETVPAKAVDAWSPVNTKYSST